MDLKKYSGFGKTFWAVIVAEIHERGAWYGLFSLLPLYLTGPVNEGALGLDHSQKGTILGVVPFFLYLLPLISGTIGDKIGYKKVLLASFAILALGYYLLSFAVGYYSFFALFMLIGLGAGMFKPMASGTVARVTKGDMAKSSVGFAVFYMMINLGGLIAPLVSGLFRPSAETVSMNGVITTTVTGSWNNVFYLSSAYMVFMFFWTLFMYKELPREKGTEKTLLTKFREMFTDIATNPKLLILLVIFLGFWTMFIQIHNMLPNWITEWVDTSALARHLPVKSWTTHGQIKAEIITSVDPFVIILFNVMVAAVVSKFRILRVIVGGIAVASLAFLLMPISGMEGWGSMFAILFITMFAFGEMASSPKFTELMGRIAPAGKEGTYQAYGFLSVAGGFLLGGKLSALYGDFADKTAMYKGILSGQYGVSSASMKDIGVYDLAEMLRSRGVDLAQLNQNLWDSHKPYMVWVIVASVGLLAAVALLVYNKFVPKIGADSNES